MSKRNPTRSFSSTENPGSYSNSRWGLICLVILAISFIVYSPTLTGYFVADDFGFIQLFTREKLAVLPRLFVSDWTLGIWGFDLKQLRPVPAFSLMLDSSIFGVNPLGYHVTNVVFHALNSISVIFVARRLLRASLLRSSLAGFIFVIHPAHIEAVSWISGRTELIPTFFYLNSVLAFCLFRSSNKRGYYVVSLALFVLGLFSKELVVTLPLMIFAYDLLNKYIRLSRAEIKKTLPHFGFLIILMSYLLLRRMVFGHSLARPSLADFPMRNIFYLVNVLLPVEILPTGKDLSFFPQTAKGAWLVFLSAGLLFGTAVILFIKSRLRARIISRFKGSLGPIIFIGPAWYLISIMPMFATYLSRRHLYLPSAGICISLAFLLPRLMPNPTRVIVILLLVIFYGGSLLRANWVWREASELSGRMRVEVEAAARDIPSGSAILLNLPGKYAAAFTWIFATPFVLRKPFSQSDFYDRFQVVESPRNYCCLWEHDKMTSVESLAERPVDSYLLYLDTNNHVVKKSISKEQLQKQLRSFLLISQVKEERDKNLENGAAADDWDLLWKTYIGDY